MGRPTTSSDECSRLIKLLPFLHYRSHLLFSIQVLMSASSPLSCTEHQQPHTLTFQAVNNASIKTFSKGAKVHKPILGADFLCQFNLLVNYKNHQLLD